MQIHGGHLVDACAGGVGIATQIELPRYCQVMIWGNLGARLIRQNAVVRWCRPTKASSFRIGLLFSGEPVCVTAEEFNSLGTHHDANPIKPQDEADNYFSILGVDVKDGMESISRAYRILCERFEPQNYRSEDENMMRKVQQAYAVLSNSESRKVYMKAMGITGTTWDEDSQNALDKYLQNLS